MKIKWFIGLVFFLASIANADIPDLPPEYCYGNCTAKMTEIVDGFNASASAPRLPAAVYSGSCYYLTSMYNPDHEHFGAFLWDEGSDGKPNFSGSYGFFFEENPWKKWTIKEAREGFRPVDQSGLVVKDHVAHIHFVDEDGGIVAAYWLRQNQTTKEVFQITYLGPQMQSFCRFSPNKAE